MKKVFLSIVLVLSAGAAVTFAQSSKTMNSYLQASFKETFSTATDVNWKQTKNYDKATFTMGGQVLSAFFKDAGQPFAISRNISTSQLPLSLLSDLKRTYADYWVSDLFELMIDGRTEYYITLENRDKKIIMKSDDSDNWYRFNRTATL